jgi:hypothetical protein
MSGYFCSDSVFVPLSTCSYKIGQHLASHPHPYFDCKTYISNHILLPPDSPWRWRLTYKPKGRPTSIVNGVKPHSDFSVFQSYHGLKTNLTFRFMLGLILCLPVHAVWHQNRTQAFLGHTGGFRFITLNGNFSLKKKTVMSHTFHFNSKKPRFPNKGYLLAVFLWRFIRHSSRETAFKLGIRNF